MKKTLPAILAATTLLIGCVLGSGFAAAEIDAERTVYKNGNIYTANAEQDYATALVVENGKIIYVGDDAGAAAYEADLSADRIVDLGEELVTPGIIEGHTHFSFMAAMKSLHYRSIPMEISGSLEKSLDYVRAYVAEHPDYDQYVLGDFSQAFDLGAAQLDEICPDKPIICVGMGLHCGYVNTKFLEAGNITKDTPDVIERQTYLVRDAEGNPTGKIVELPQTWSAFQAAMKLDNEKVCEELLKLQDLYHSYGITGVAEGGFLGLDEENMLRNLTELEAEGSLNLLVCPATIWYGHTVTSLDEITERALHQKETYTTELIRPGTVKMWADGTFGALSALMREPYDGTDSCGVYLNTVEDLIACAQMCKENDLNIHYHAIGDKAVENVLTAFETVGETTGTKSLVHFEITAYDLIERAAKIPGLIVNMTPIWATPLSKEEVDPVGARRDTYVLYKEAMDAGITVNFGADSNGPAECWNPIFNVLAAMYRDPDVETFSLKGNPCTFEEAVDAYTINVARERRIDDEYGSIEVGKSADFVVWNVDGMTELLYRETIESYTDLTDNEIAYAQSVYFRGERVYPQ